jgi:hypothetical protein
MTKIRLLFGAALLLSAFPSARAEEADPAADQQTLRDAKIGSDAPSLLAFFAKRTPDETMLRRIDLLTRQLGDPSFRARERAGRELVAYGRLALPALQKAARFSDLEISWRAEECLKSIEAADDSPLVCAAVRQLGILKPPQTTAFLLGYVPFASNSLVREEVVRTLAASSTGRPDPELVRALDDPRPERRVAAVEALGRAGAVGKVSDIRKLLRDPVSSVRLKIAVALAQAEVREAVPVLIDLLTELPAEESWQADEVLRQLAGDKSPALPGGADGADRKKYHDAWVAWWRTSGPSVDLAELQRAPRVLGYTMMILLDAGKVREVDLTGRKRWEISGLAFPLDAQMIGNDRVLVTEFHANRISERDTSGRVLWEKEVPAPLTAQRLANGHTFIGAQAELLELDRSGKQVWSLPVPSLVFKAAKLPNGDVAYISGENQFIRVDAKGQELNRFPAHLDYSGGRLEVLPNGHVVVPEANSNRVVEFDEHGKIVWEASIEEPVAARRLPNGNTLVTSHNSARGVEIDRHGNVVWQYKADSRVSRMFRR